MTTESFQQRHYEAFQRIPQNLLTPKGLNSYTVDMSTQRRETEQMKGRERGAITGSHSTLLP